jgi:hypothetical protein
VKRKTERDRQSVLSRITPRHITPARYAPFVSEAVTFNRAKYEADNSVIPKLQVYRESLHNVIIWLSMPVGIKVTSDCQLHLAEFSPLQVQLQLCDLPVKWRPHIDYDETLRHFSSFLHRHSAASKGGLINEKLQMMFKESITVAFRCQTLWPIPVAHDCASTPSLHNNPLQDIKHSRRRRDNIKLDIREM